MSTVVVNPSLLIDPLDHGVIIQTYKDLYISACEQPSYKTLARNLNVKEEELKTCIKNWGLKFTDLKTLAFPQDHLLPPEKKASSIGVSKEQLLEAAEVISQDSFLSQKELASYLSVSYKDLRILYKTYDLSLFKLISIYQPETFGESLLSSQGKAIVISDHARDRFRERFPFQEIEPFFEKLLLDGNLEEYHLSKKERILQTKKHGYIARIVFSRKLNIILVLPHDLTRVITVIPFTNSKLDKLTKLTQKFSPVHFPKIY